MPELGDVIDQEGTGKSEAGTTTDTGVTEATVIENDKPEVDENQTPETTATSKDEDVGKDSTPTKKPAAKKKATTKKTVAKTAKDEDGTKDDGKEEAKKMVRPPLEQITRDFEAMVTDQEIDGKPIKKLEYKCGKIIYGLSNNDGKDFRVLAFKARKKSRTVAGKSRVIYYFGINKEYTVVTKAVPQAHSTKFGACAVQSKKPVELVLDKTTFTEKFAKDTEKVMAALKKLLELTVAQKTDAYEELKAKQEEKKAAAEAKKAAAKKKEAKEAAAKKAAKEVANDK